MNRFLKNAPVTRPKPGKQNNMHDIETHCSSSGRVFANIITSSEPPFHDYYSAINEDMSCAFICSREQKKESGQGAGRRTGNREKTEKERK